VRALEELASLHVATDRLFGEGRQAGEFSKLDVRFGMLMVQYFRRRFGPARACSADSPARGQLRWIRRQEPAMRLRLEVTFRFII
jgi:hypothetical protein